MSKKKHPEHVNHERWLVSYADFITLLFAFFVVLFASGQSDKKKQKEMAGAMQAAFNQPGMFIAHQGTPAISQGGGSSAAPVSTAVLPSTAPDASAKTMSDVEKILHENAQQSAAIGSVTQGSLGRGGTETKGGQAEKEKLSLIEKEALARSGKSGQADGPGSQKGHSAAGDNGHGSTRTPPPPPADSITVRQTADGLIISLHEAGIFDSGSAQVDADAVPLIERIASALPPGQLRIEGHTDNVPIHSTQYASNWELSTARASAIARIVLQYSSVNPAQLAVAGYAEYHPVASNATEEGRRANRRVDIVVTPSKSPTSSTSSNNTAAGIAAASTPPSHPSPSR